jgi:FMN phosphatase YigB (HAD superfamily)
MKQSPKVAPVLVLDVGQVCISLAPEACAKILKVDRLEDLLIEHPEIGMWIEKLEIGEIDSNQFLAGVSDVLRISRETIRLAWMANIGRELPLIAGIVDEAIAAGLSVVLMSDTSPMHTEVFFPALSFSKRVAGCVYSYEVGARKPSPAMYEAVEQQFCDGGVPLLFADDKTGNTDTAKARGWGAFTVIRHDLNGLRTALRAQLATYRTQ